MPRNKDIFQDEGWYKLKRLQFCLLPVSTIRMLTWSHRILAITAADCSKYIFQGTKRDGFAQKLNVDREQSKRAQHVFHRLCINL